MGLWKLLFIRMVMNLTEKDIGILGCLGCGRVVTHLQAASLWRFLITHN
jgi:hypothetical protein